MVVHQPATQPGRLARVDQDQRENRVAVLTDGRRLPGLHTAQLAALTNCLHGRPLHPSTRVVEDDPDCVAHTGADAADTVAKIHAVVALRAPDWPVMDGEGHRITLLQRYDLGAALHARALFGQHELATGEVGAGLGEQNRDLNREREIAVEILMEAVEVPRDVLQ